MRVIDKPKEQLLSELLQMHQRIAQLEKIVAERKRMAKKASILIVDDDEGTRSSLAMALSKQGYKTETAGTGQEALKKAEGRFFNIALLDIRLPGMSGIELVAPLKKIHPEMVVIIVTGYASVETAVQALNLGASGYVTKPLNMQQVLALVKDTLEKQQLIADKQRAEEALRESEQFNFNLVEQSPHPILVMKTDTTLVRVNPALEQLTGYSASELTGLKAPYPWWTEETPKDKIGRDFRAAKDGKGERFEEKLRNKSGEIFWVEIIPTAIILNGEHRYNLVISTDITERKQAEEKVREAETLRELDRLRNELVANISHEIRTPLASIKGFATTLLQTDVKWSEQEQSEFLTAIDQETDRLTRLISDLLDMSRLEGGALKLDKDNYQIAEILELVNDSLLSLTEQHQLQVIVPEDLPSVFVDAMRIGQVLTNLVENATKFSLTGSPIIIEAEPSDEWVILSVTDMGEGIPPELLDRVFDRFYQTESIATGRKTGTGLGLSICRGIVEAHGGKIWMESTAGEGSKFSFKLPVSKKEKEVAQNSNH